MTIQKTAGFAVGYDAEGRREMQEAYEQWMKAWREGKNPKASAMSLPSREGASEREPLFHD